MQVGDQTKVDIAAPLRDGSTALYLIVHTPGVTDVVTLDDGHEIVVGRAEGAGLRIEGAEVSRVHTVFRRRGSAVEVEDLGSRNGTWIEGQRLRGRALLWPGAGVRIGSVLIGIAVCVEAPGPRRSLTDHVATSPLGEPGLAMPRARTVDDRPAPVADPGEVLDDTELDDAEPAELAGADDARDPGDAARPTRSPSASGTMRAQLDEAESAAIAAALVAERGNQTRAARRLGISRRSLVYKLTKYGLR